MLEYNRPTLREAIDGEILSYQHRYGDQWQNRYFNNFMAHFSDGIDDIRVNMFNYRSLYDENIQNTTFAELNPGLKEKGASSLLLEQTPKDFYSTVDRVSEEIGVSLDVIVQYRQEILNDRPMNELHDLLKPVFIRLRELGYNRYPDLVE